MSRDRIGVWATGAAIVFAIIVQIGVFVIAAGPNLAGPDNVAEAMNQPTAK